MKFYCLLFVYVVALLWLEVKADCASLEHPGSENVVPEGSVFYIETHCTKYICQNGQFVRDGACSLPKCKNNAIPAMDSSKRYPDCCPVCPVINEAYFNAYL